MEEKVARSEVLFYDTVMRVFRGLTDFFGDIEVKGLRNIPAEGGALLIANHLSYFDPVALGGALDRSGRNTKALAKSELFTNPVMRALLTNLGQVPVYRNSERAKEALTIAEQCLLAGDAIAIYPEGTIPADGKLMPFKTGAARLALKTHVPVIPIAQAGANEIIRSDTKEIFRTAGKAIVTQPSLRVVVGEPLMLSGDWNSKEDVVRATALMHDTIEALLARIEEEEWQPVKSLPEVARDATAAARQQIRRLNSSIALTFAAHRARKAV